MLRVVGTRRAAGANRLWRTRCRLASCRLRGILLRGHWRGGRLWFASAAHKLRGLRKLAVINNHFHMPRARAVFEHVFRVPPKAGEPETAYELEYVSVDDRLSAEVLEVRRQKEETALPRFAPGGPWQRATPTLRQMHDWLYQENTAYATKRLLEVRKPLDPELMKSY